MKQGLKLPKFPFELSNRVEARARQTTISPQEWQILIDLIAELLNTIDKSLAESNLNFSIAFEKARIEISGDYPFLSPISGIFSYKDGKISMEEQVSPTLFAASINETSATHFGKVEQQPEVFRCSPDSDTKNYRSYSPK